MNKRKDIIRQVLREQLYNSPDARKVTAARTKSGDIKTSSNDVVSVEPKWYNVDSDFIDVFGEDFVYSEFESMGYDIDREGGRVGISWSTPLPKNKMSAPTGGQKFGASREGYSHDGVDYGAEVGTTIYAVKDGTVSNAGTIDKNCGTGVILNLNNGYRAVYCHMSRVSVSDGEKVRVGQKIGEVGTSGHSEGAHLHLKIVNSSGNPIDNWSLIFSKL